MSKKANDGEILIDAETKYDLAKTLASPQQPKETALSETFQALFDIKYTSLTRSAANENEYTFKFGLNAVVAEGESIRVKRDNVKTFFHMLHSLECSGVALNPDKMKEVYKESFGEIPAASSFNPAARSEKPKAANQNKEYFLNSAQKAQEEAIMSQESRLILTDGLVGTGKTFIACRAAFNLLKAKRVDRIVLSRVNIGAGPTMGYLPGDSAEKMAPWLRPLYEELEHIIPEGKKGLSDLVQKGTIQFLPLEHARGLNLDKTILIVDEAQNLQEHQLETLVTRAKEETKVVVIGDSKGQVDVYNSGFGFIVDAVEKAGKDNLLVTRYDKPEYVIRSKMVRDFLEVVTKARAERAENQPAKPTGSKAPAPRP